MRRALPVLFLFGCNPSAVDDRLEPPEQREAPIEEPFRQPLPGHRCSGGDAETHYEEVTRCAGIVAQRTHLASYNATGQAFGDYDNDGLLDLYVTDSVGFNTLYHNNGDGTFSISRLFDQVSEELDIGGGAVFVDYDNDGWRDLYVLNWGENHLYRNVEGREFVDVTEEAGVGDPGKGITATWGDYDNDGYVDLYVANWLCPECEGDYVDAGKDALYHANGDGTFENVSHLLGDHELSGAGFVGLFFDYDNDADLDIYVVNDKGWEGEAVPDAPMNRNVFFENRGPGCDGWCFIERARAANADLRIESMGIAVADYDGDNDLDVFVSNTGWPYLLQNQGDRTFVDVAQSSGAGYDHKSWGANFLDFDNDGDLDLYYALGESFGFDGPNRLMSNNGDGTFDDVSDVSGADDADYTIGTLTGDYDNDGAVDIVVGNWARDYRLYRNLATEKTENNWISIRLIGSGPVNRDAIGARVEVVDSEGRSVMQEVKCGSSSGSGNDIRLHFGLGKALADRAYVRWPNGITQRVEVLPTNDQLELHYRE